MAKLLTSLQSGHHVRHEDLAERRQHLFARSWPGVAPGKHPAGERIEIHLQFLAVWARVKN